MGIKAKPRLCNYNPLINFRFFLTMFSSTKTNFKIGSSKAVVVKSPAPNIDCINLSNPLCNLVTSDGNYRLKFNQFYRYLASI